MRMVKREKCSVKDYEQMRQWVLDNCPFGLLNSEYDAKNSIGYLYFWDSDYIPTAWEQWIVRPAAKTSSLPKVSETYKQ